MSNPVDGSERWFEPGRELLVVSSAEEATAATNGGMSVSRSAVAGSSTRRTAVGRASRTTRPSLSSICRMIVGFIR